MNSFFYPTPSSAKFNSYTWESWNKLKSRSLKKKTASKSNFRQTSNNLFHIPKNPTRTSSEIPVISQKPVKCIKNSRNKSENLIQELMNQKEIFYTEQDFSVKVKKKPVPFNQSHNFTILLQGTRLNSQLSSRPRPVSIKNFTKPKTRSFTVVKKPRNEDIETPTPW